MGFGIEQADYKWFYKYLETGSFSYVELIVTNDNNVISME
jgi:hypothetical protein